MAGSRGYNNGSLSNVGSNGLYWSSSVDGDFASNLYFESSNADVFFFYRARGYSVRCLED